MSWQELQPSTPYRNGVPIDLGAEEQWANDTYVVHKRVHKANDGSDLPPMIHLSIRRQDREPCRDWRDFQRIKNQLAGPEWEGVEIYPAESRIVDMANQYHLFCFQFHIDIGWDEGRLIGNQAQADATAPGAVQRNPEKIDLKYGGLTPLKKMKEHNAVNDYLPREE